MGFGVALDCMSVIYHALAWRLILLFLERWRGGFLMNSMGCGDYYLILVAWVEMLETLCRYR